MQSDPSIHDRIVRIDGTVGEGGGQVLRTSLTLSLVTGRPLQITSIRAKRDRPGLLRQHLTAVQAAAAISSADVEGDHLGSTSLWFRPGPVRPGDYTFQVGTAGSACLVAQTVLLPLALAGGPSSLAVEGGTHNRMAPPFDAIRDAWLPHVRAMGFGIDARIVRHGFYPVGGGDIRFTIRPAKTFVPLSLERRGEISGRCAQAILSRIAPSVGKRELDVVVRRTSLTKAQCEVVEADARGPGNALVVKFDFESGSEVFCGFGELGKRAEAVASDAVDEMQEWFGADVPVGVHLADQLLLPMALAAGGVFRTQPVSLHTTTNAAVIAAFLGDVMSFTDEAEPAPGASRPAVRVRVAGRH